MSMRSKDRRRARSAKRGQAPGTANYVGSAPGTAIAVRVIHYDTDQVELYETLDEAAVERARATHNVTWINLDGLHDAARVQAVTAPFGVHPLWVEDLLNTTSRPKAEAHQEALLAIVRMARVVDGELTLEHVGLVAGPGWVLSFQERPGDVWDQVRARIDGGARIRRMGTAYLLHALLDAVVDEYFVAVEHLDGRVDALESEAMQRAPKDLVQRVHALREEVNAFRNASRPIREAAAQLARGDASLIDEATRPFFRDLHDHTLQVMELTDGTRDRLASVLELHLALTSHQLNEVMQVLTVVSTIFIPLTFIAGIYGMNFEYMPELKLPWGYAGVWVLMLAVAAGMIALYRRRGWL